MTERDYKMTKQTSSKGYLPIIILFLVFAIPYIAANLFYKHGKEFFSAKMNKGRLIQPVKQFSELNLFTQNGKAFDKHQTSKKWSLIFITPQKCQQNCFANLFKMRQVRLALHKDADRVARMFISLKDTQTPSFDKVMRHDYKGTEQFIISKESLQHFLQDLPSKTIAYKEGYLYLMDPLGNIIMSYAPDANPKDLYNDLKRLLKVSQIG